MKPLFPSSLALALAVTCAPAQAADITTHVLDISRGEGGSGIPVTLSRQSSDGSWESIAQTRTGANGRAEDFGDHDALNAGTYLLSFDMTAYDESPSAPFFPVITIAFVVTEDDGTYHVPVLVSPYGYSTYRGN